MDSPIETDQECVKKAQEGDSKAFGLLVDRYEAKLLRYGKKFLSTQADVEDIVQDVFVSAYRNIKNFDLSQKFSPWIYRIAHNAFIDGMKKKTRSPFIAMDFDTLISYPICDESLEEKMRHKEIMEVIEGGLDHLSPKYREAIILYYMEELSYKEIADVLQIPLGTVCARINRGKKEIRLFAKTSVNYEP